MTFELRPYQMRAEQQARIALAGGERRACLNLQTGGGKTLTATSIILVRFEGGETIALSNIGLRAEGWAFHKYHEFTGKEARGLRQVGCTPTPEILGWIKHRQIAAAKTREKGASHAGR